MMHQTNKYISRDTKLETYHYFKSDLSIEVWHTSVLLKLKIYDKNLITN